MSSSLTSGTTPPQHENARLAPQRESDGRSLTARLRVTALSRGRGQRGRPLTPPGCEPSRCARPVPGPGGLSQGGWPVNTSEKCLLGVEFPAHLDEPCIEARNVARVFLESVEDCPRTGAKRKHRGVVPAGSLDAKWDEDRVDLQFNAATVHGVPQPCVRTAFARRVPGLVRIGRGRPAVPDRCRSRAILRCLVLSQVGRCHNVG